MIENISFVNFDLSVRKICLGSEQKFVAVTLGEGSYIVDASLEYGSLRCHVMVGKYCSIAHGIKFMIDVNHDTEAVSTYPFDVAFKQEAKEREFGGGKATGKHRKRCMDWCIRDYFGWCANW